ncbi:hypothetical protein SNEBB_004117 [Seison nebaliae]|nr:hypothetical protein SNEBB_004117 [Seison nebaliae]
MTNDFDDDSTMKRMPHNTNNSGHKLANKKCAVGKTEDGGPEKVTLFIPRADCHPFESSVIGIILVKALLCLFLFLFLWICAFAFPAIASIRRNTMY